ncbi:hypothetical protein [Clostridium sp.]|uniref:hypothetical protein n=1 Tax=Clostridium sp. TaxID=1506 RepID=UPI002843D5FF|nr:hypothetical protein [Clostridium sp.]MDR3594721.1 hypothetical protein [Clostridium sp.]
MKQNSYHVKPKGDKNFENKMKMNLKQIDKVEKEYTRNKHKIPEYHIIPQELIIKQKKLSLKEQFEQQNREAYLNDIKKLNIKNLQRLAKNKTNDKSKLVSMISKRYTLNQLQQIAILREELGDTYNRKHKEYRTEIKKAIKRFSINNKIPKVHEFQSKSDNEDEYDISNYITNNEHKVITNKDKSANYDVYITTLKPYPLASSTVPHIIEYVLNESKQKAVMYQKKYPQGMIFKTKLSFCGDEDKNIILLVLLFME